MYKDLETYLSIKENKDRVRERNNKSDRSIRDLTMILEVMIRILNFILSMIE